MDSIQKLTKAQLTDFSPEIINFTKESQRSMDVMSPIIIQEQSQTISQPSLNNNLMLGEPITPRYIVVMSRICLGAGIIMMLGAVLMIFGIFTLSGGIDIIVELLLMGVVYYTFMAESSVFCIVTFVLILLAKHKYHISARKPLLLTIVGLTMIHLPNIIFILL